MEPAFNIAFEHEIGYLRAEITGEADSYKVTTEYWKRIGEELSLTGYKRLLVVEMLQEKMKGEDAVRAIRERDPKSFQGVRIAFFDMKKDHTGSNVSGAAAASQLGYDLKLFSDIHKAKDWLLDA